MSGWSRPHPAIVGSFHRPSVRDRGTTALASDRGFGRRRRMTCTFGRRGITDGIHGEAGGAGPSSVDEHRTLRGCARRETPAQEGGRAEAKDGEAGCHREAAGQEAHASAGGRRGREGLMGWAVAARLWKGRLSVRRMPESNAAASDRRGATRVHGHRGAPAPPHGATVRDEGSARAGWRERAGPA